MYRLIFIMWFLALENVLTSFDAVQMVKITTEIFFSVLLVEVL